PDLRNHDERPDATDFFNGLLGLRRQQVLSDGVKPRFDPDLGGARHAGSDDRRQEQLVPDMLAETEIGLELGLGEELIGGGVVREVRLVQPVATNELAFIAGQRQLEIDQIAEALAAAAFGVRITDAAEGEMRVAESASLAKPQRLQSVLESVDEDTCGPPLQSR